MKKQLTSGALAAILVLSSLSQMACGNATNLARIGAVAVGFANGYKTELNSLLLANAISQDTFNKRDKEADQIIRDAQALQNYLNSLPGVNSANKAQVVAKIGEAVSLVRAVIASAASLGANSQPLKILNIIVTVLGNAAIAIDALFPAVPVAGAAPRVQVITQKPTREIVVPLPPIPRNLQRYATR